MPAEGSVRVLSWPAKREAASDGAVAGVASEPKGTTMHDRFEVSVTFDPAKGYAATAPELREPVLALSLGGVRRRVEARCCCPTISTSCYSSTCVHGTS